MFNKVSVSVSVSDATQSAVMPQYVVCLSVRLSVTSGTVIT